MKKFLLSSIMVIPALVSAQVTLNAGLAPVVNTAIIYYDANVPSPAFTFNKSGTANTWDFQSVTPVPMADDTAFYYDPSTVPFSSSFPGATHATREDSDNGYTMIQVTTNGVSLLGNVVDIAGNGNLLPVTTTGPILTLPFPYSYGSSNAANGVIDFYALGSQVGQPLADSVHLKSTVSQIRDVIASGDIILPSGTFNAILERTIDSVVDTIWFKSVLTGGLWVIAPGSPTSSLDSSFYWYTGNSLAHYAHALYDNTGLHDVHYYKATTTITTTALTENHASDEMNIYPNPATDVLHLSIPVNSGINFISIYDMKGNMVYKLTTDLPKVTISQLKNGLYLVNCVDGNGKQYSSKFIKH